MTTAFTIDRVRWSNLDIFNQMGNIYSEVGRSFKTIDHVDSEEHRAAMARAIDLFDATIEVLIEKKSPKAKEVLRAKEVYLELANDPSADLKSIQSLEKYFMQFAIAARLNR